MLTKKKGDRVPKENIQGNTIKNMTVEGWLKNKDLWDYLTIVFVQTRDFVVDVETQCLYVNKTAWASKNKWVDGYVTIHRIHDGWLRGDYDERIKFKSGDVAKDQHYQIINMLYKSVKVDNIVDGWWNN